MSRPTRSPGFHEPERHQPEGPYSMSKYDVLSLSEALEHGVWKAGTNVGVARFCARARFNTHIHRDARNRPTHMGGPQQTRANEGGGNWPPETPRQQRVSIRKRVGESVVDADPQQDVLAFVKRRFPPDCHQGPPPPFMREAMNSRGLPIMKRGDGPGKLSLANDNWLRLARDIRS